MEPWLIVAVVAVVVLATAAFVFVPRRGSAGVDEPPPRPGDRDAEASREISTDTLVEERVAPESADAGLAGAIDEAPAPSRPRMRDRLSKARGAVAGYLASVVSRSGIDAATWDDLEEALIRADVGVSLSAEILDGLRSQVKVESISDPERLLTLLREDLTARLQVEDRRLHLVEGGTSVWLLVGVNGVGKTTTAGKLGARYKGEGTEVVMVAGDTFRAAAAEQLQTWAERCGAQFVRGAEGADPSSVIFDGIESGAARGAGLVVCDTAGRLHNKSNLMDELAKVRRVADKAPGEVSEVLLVIDATTGQNGLAQAKVFTEATDVTGVVLTKLDGSAKGGIVLAIQSELQIPVKLVGLGETAEDLVDFDPSEFVDALLNVEEP